MFWSKIWFFLIAVAAAVALTIALVMPRPAQRALATEEHRRLTVACGVISILLTDDARGRVDLAGSFARRDEVINALESASNAASIDDARSKGVLATAKTVIETIRGKQPDFAILIDRKGRVVARYKIDENDFGDVLAGRPLIDDALAGYLRDDLWVVGNSLYFVAASPVVKRDGGADYSGAVVFGHQVTNKLAKELVGSLEVDVGFFLGPDSIAGSKSIALDQTVLQREVGRLTGPKLSEDCGQESNKPTPLRAGNEDFLAKVARLPGEAAAKKAFYAVFLKRPAEVGFGATLKVVSQTDLGFGQFPWFLVGGLFVLALGGGIGLMLWEGDRPLRKLTGDAVRLAKGETERLAEDAHPGKFGSIARSVNIHIDKLGREAKSAKKDLDGLLGPAPEGSLGTIDLLATALPSVRPGGPVTAVSPPPSEFRFGDSGPTIARPSAPTPATPRPAAPPVPRQGMTPPPAALPTPPQMAMSPMPRMPTPPPFSQPAPYATPSPLLADQLGASLDDDILGSEHTVLGDPYFRQVFDQFISVKKSCNEPTSASRSTSSPRSWSRTATI
ncbi:MAG: hypothetical protein WKG01_21565 [Kofleriaceae bacterium]